MFSRQIIFLLILFYKIFLRLSTFPKLHIDLSLDDLDTRPEGDSCGKNIDLLFKICTKYVLTNDSRKFSKNYVIFIFGQQSIPFDSSFTSSLSRVNNRSMIHRNRNSVYLFYIGSMYDFYRKRNIRHISFMSE